MRRRVAAKPVSLFAFQDVMTGTIGILIIIMLVMCLELTEVASTAQLRFDNSAEVPDPDADSRIEDLQTRIRDLESMVEAASGEVAALSHARGSDQRREIGRLQAELIQAHDSLRTTRHEIERTSGRLERIVEAETAVGSGTNALDRLEQHVNQLRATLEEQRRSNRLIYIASKEFELAPVLMEVSDRSIKVGGTTDADSIIEFTESDPGVRVDQALTWAGSFSSRQYYFLLLIKPSAIETAYLLEAKLRESRFQVGRDLIPEDRTAVLESSAGG